MSLFNEGKLYQVGLVYLEVGWDVHRIILLHLWLVRLWVCLFLKKHSPERAKAIWEYFKWVRDNDSYMTYVIINPQANRDKGTGEQQDEFLATGVDENAEGITVRGEKNAWHRFNHGKRSSFC